MTADDQFINHYLLENVTAVLDVTRYNIIPTLGADSDVLQTVIKNQVVTRLTHEGRTTPPRLTRPFFRVVDEVLCKVRVMHVIYIQVTRLIRQDKARVWRHRPL